MGKIIASVMVFVFWLITSASTSLSSPMPPGPRYHPGPRPPLAGPGPRAYPGYGWGYFGAGLLTGAFLTIALTPPPPKPAPVVYRPAPVVYKPAPVVYQPAPTVVAQPPATEAEPKAVLRQVIPNPTLLNVRLIPDLNSVILGQVSRGEVLDVIGTAPGWLYIRTGTGNYGWVMEQYTRNRVEPAG